MEKNQAASEKTERSSGVFRKDVYMGVVSLIKEMDKHEPTTSNSVILDESQTKKIVAIDIRNIIFNNNYQKGEDIIFKLGMRDRYTYKIMNSNESCKNNTIVIREEQSLNEFLAYLGFPDYLKAKDLRLAKEVLLSPSTTIDVRSHTISLQQLTNINPEMVKYVKEQVQLVLGSLKNSELPSKPQEIEKVYPKYFEKM